MIKILVKVMIKPILLTFLLIVKTSDFEKKLASINKTYQTYLDNGEFMADCSLDFLGNVSDLMEMIIAVYQENESPEIAKSLLLDQKKWEIEKEEIFESIDLRLDSIQEANGMIPKDELMFSYNDKGKMIAERIIQLIQLAE